MVSTLTVCECCDACGTPAVVTAFRDGQVLVFCGHHGSQFRSSLRTQGWLISDELLQDSDQTPTSATAGRARLTGPPGKMRDPLRSWLLLIATLGVYYLVWYYRINRELRDFDPTIKVRPALGALVQLVPVVGLVGVYRTGQRIRQAQMTAGACPDASGEIGVETALLFAMVVPYYNSELNSLWQGR
jgi:hypothetical protein